MSAVTEKKKREFNDLDPFVSVLSVYNIKNIKINSKFDW